MTTIETEKTIEQELRETCDFIKFAECPTCGYRSAMVFDDARTQGVEARYVYCHHCKKIELIQA